MSQAPAIDASAGAPPPLTPADEPSPPPPGYYLPLASDPTQPGILAGSDHGPHLEIETDVCVIGSGAGGAVVAAALAERGARVVVVEEGDYLSGQQFNQREDLMLRALFQERGGRSTHDRSITILQGRGVGGSPVHNTCLAFRAPAPVLEGWAKSSGLESLSPEEMARFYEHIERAVDVKPILEREVNAHNRVLLDAMRRLHWRGGLAHHNRTECLECGFCELGCAYDRKNNTLKVWIPRAVRAGARVFSQCRVDRLTMEGAGSTQRCRGVTGVIVKGPAEEAAGTFRLRAHRTIVAAGAIHTPILLRRSGVARAGEALFLHPAVAVGGLFPHPLDSWAGLPQSVYCDEFGPLDAPPDETEFLLLHSFAHPIGTAVNLAGFGTQHRAMMRRYRHMAAITPMVLHDQPALARVDEDRSGRPRIRYQLSQLDIERLRHGSARAAEALFAAGALEVSLPGTSGRLYARLEDAQRAARQLDLAPLTAQVLSTHPQGTCPMGPPERGGVVDGHGAPHGTEGLWVVDASIFPGSLGAPPQITIMALALRLAVHLSQVDA